MNLKKNTLHMTIGNGLFALFQILNITVLARLGGAEEVGKFFKENFTTQKMAEKTINLYQEELK